MMHEFHLMLTANKQELYNVQQGINILVSNTGQKTCCDYTCYCNKGTIMRIKLYTDKQLYAYLYREPFISDL